MRIDNNIKCNICAHKIVCSFRKEVEEFKEKIDNVCLTEPLNIISTMDWKCRYFWYNENVIEEKSNGNR